MCIIPTKYFHWRKNSDSIYYYRGSRANGLY
ncbi:rod shape-determining protein MreC, partial [Staphylococcus aureus]